MLVGRDRIDVESCGGNGDSNAKLLLHLLVLGVFPYVQLPSTFLFYCIENLHSAFLTEHGLLLRTK
jgi:hypothetical protein